MIEMSEVFEKPKIVMVSTLDLKFPEICPVCGQPAEVPNNMIIADSSEKGAVAASTPTTYDAFNMPIYSSKGPASRMSTKLKVYVVPSCPEHAIRKDKKKSKFKLIFGLLLFILPFLGLMTYLSISSILQNGGNLLIPITIFVIYLIITGIFGFFAYQKSLLEKYFNIIKVDSSIKVVFVKIKNKKYYDEFLRLNYPDAKEYVPNKSE